MFLNFPISYDADKLGAISEKEQYRVMEAWFRSRFEDPAQRTPYDSGEGGYIWIWGGPYDAREELNQEFQHLVSQPSGGHPKLAIEGHFKTGHR
jgi:hypothetical protein